MLRAGGCTQGRRLALAPRRRGVSRRGQQETVWWLTHESISVFRSQFAECKFPSSCLVIRSEGGRACPTASTVHTHSACSASHASSPVAWACLESFGFSSADPVSAGLLPQGPHGLHSTEQLSWLLLRSQGYTTQERAQSS